MLLDLILKVLRELPGNVFLTFPVTDIHQHIDGPDQRTVDVEQRRGKRQDRHAGAIRTLGNELLVAHRPSFPQRDGHRARVMAHRCAVRPEQTPADTPFVGARRGVPSGQLRGGRIVIADLAGGVGEIDGHRQRIEGVTVVAHALLQPLPLSGKVRNISGEPRDFRDVILSNGTRPGRIPLGRGSPAFAPRLLSPAVQRTAIRYFRLRVNARTGNTAALTRGGAHQGLFGCVYISTADDIGGRFAADGIPPVHRRHLRP